MIIWGTRGLTSTVDEGTFHCPRCGPGKRFKLMVVKRWFTLYFIPIIPMGQAGRYVECKGCAGTFDPQVRDYDPEEENARFRAQLGDVMLRCLVSMARADGSIDHRELEVIADVLTRLVGSAYEVEDVQAAVNTAPKESLDRVLKEIAPSLNDQGKVLVIHGLALVARADGDVSEEELDVVFQAGKTLGLRRNDVQRILAVEEG